MTTRFPLLTVHCDMLHYLQQEYGWWMFRTTSTKTWDNFATYVRCTSHFTLQRQLLNSTWLLPTREERKIRHGMVDWCPTYETSSNQRGLSDWPACGRMFVRPVHYQILNLHIANVVTPLNQEYYTNINDRKFPNGEHYRSANSMSRASTVCTTSHLQQIFRLSATSSLAQHTPFKSGICACSLLLPHYHP